MTNPDEERASAWTNPADNRPGSVSFERLAEIYDETRGGLIRGAGLADDLAPFVVGPRILEVGVGTGAVAVGLAEASGLPVLGIDLSPAMLARAAERLGPRVAAGDAATLPVATGALDTVIMVWVLQLVESIDAVLAEVARVLRPGGHFGLVLSSAEFRPDDIDAEMKKLYRTLGPRRADDRDLISDLLEGAGLTIEGCGFTTEQEWDETPVQSAERLEQRTYGFLLDFPEELFQSIVLPAARALRALPEPERPRRRASSHRLFVSQRA